MILAGDIGGTKSQFALFNPLDNKIIWEARYASANFSSFDALANQIKKDLKQCSHKLSQIERAALAIAGPIQNNSCQTTNLPWFIDGEQLASQLSLEKVTLLNDVEATALSIPHLNGSQLAPITPWTKGQAHKAIAVIAPGTGLGEAALFWNGTSYQAQASEGGHKDFAPRSDLEFGLFKYAEKQFGHVSVERILGGSGITLIYHYLQDVYGKKDSQEVQSQISTGDSNANITRLALAKKSVLCGEALEIYVSLLAAECANIALQYMSLGGVVLAGGIPPKIRSAFQSRFFLDSYLDKGRYKNMLEKIPVRLCLEENSALIGAAFQARL
jgi:glucokinase